MNDSIKAAAAALDALPPKERGRLSGPLAQLLPHIQDALQKGYSYTDVAGYLAEHGIPISPTTLGRHVRRAQPSRSAARAKHKRT